MVGVASAGAGLGTTAYFSDGDGYDENTITAGEFGLKVEPNVDKSSVDQDGIGPDELEFGDDGGSVFAGGIVEVDDAKPGDTYKFCWDIKVKENPGYVKIGVPRYADEEGDVSTEDLFDTDELSTLGTEATGRLIVKVEGESYEVAEESLGELLENLGDSGYALPSFVGDDGVGTLSFGWPPFPWPPHEPKPEETEYCHQFKDGKDHSKTVTVCIEIEIPTDVGNEIQGATLDWDFLVYAEQCRHNDVDDFEDAELPEISS